MILLDVRSRFWGCVMIDTLSAVTVPYWEMDTRTGDIVWWLPGARVIYSPRDRNRGEAVDDADPVERLTAVLGGAEEVRSRNGSSPSEHLSDHRAEAA